MKGEAGGSSTVVMPLMKTEGVDDLVELTRCCVVLSRTTSARVRARKSSCRSSCLSD